MTPRRLVPAVLLLAAPLAGLWVTWAMAWTVAWWWRGLPYWLRLAGVA